MRSENNDSDTARAICLSNGFVYVSFYQESYTYSTNIAVIAKFTWNEGFMMWNKKIVTRNLIDSTNLYIHSFYDFKTNPRNTSYIMASMLYNWNSNAA